MKARSRRAMFALRGWHRSAVGSGLNRTLLGFWQRWGAARGRNARASRGGLMRWVPGAAASRYCPRLCQFRDEPRLPLWSSRMCYCQGTAGTRATGKKVRLFLVCGLLLAETPHVYCEETSAALRSATTASWMAAGTRR